MILDRTMTTYIDGYPHSVPRITRRDIGDDTLSVLMWEGKQVARLAHYTYAGADPSYTWCLYDADTGKLLYHSRHLFSIKAYVKHRWNTPATR